MPLESNDEQIINAYNVLIQNKRNFNPLQKDGPLNYILCFIITDLQETLLNVFFFTY